MLKRVLIILLSALAVAQLIQPDRSVPSIDPAKDMLQATGAPSDIQQLVVGACYDCHSYKTQYPVWAYITPVNFWIQGHINEGREVVNYSQWDVYAGSEEAAESGEALAEGEMPPAGYERLHGHAKLSSADKDKLIAWFNANITGAGEAAGEPGGTNAGGESEEENGKD